MGRLSPPGGTYSPADIIDELAKLQDQVPPFPSQEALEILATAFGQTADELFGSFEREPLAAASVAQVHAATLPDGESVVVKILRPGVRRSIERDLAVLYAIAELAERYWTDGPRLRALEVVSEFEKTLLKELDLMREAADAAQPQTQFRTARTRSIFPKSTGITVDPMFSPWNVSRAYPLADIDALVSAGTNIRRLAENGVTIFFTQVFHHNLFHADMHPGNIFVDVSGSGTPAIRSRGFRDRGKPERKGSALSRREFSRVFQNAIIAASRSSMWTLVGCPPLPG